MSVVAWYGHITECGNALRDTKTGQFYRNVTIWHEGSESGHLVVGADAECARVGSIVRFMPHTPVVVIDVAALCDAIRRRTVGMMDDDQESGDGEGFWDNEEVFGHDPLDA